MYSSPHTPYMCPHTTYLPPTCDFFFFGLQVVSQHGSRRVGQWSVETPALPGEWKQMTCWVQLLNSQQREYLLRFSKLKLATKTTTMMETKIKIRIKKSQIKKNTKNIPLRTERGGTPDV